MTIREKERLHTLTPEDVISSIKESRVRFVDLQFTDLTGRLRHVTIPAQKLDEDSFKVGIPKLDGSSIRGFVEINESDLLLIPDPTTYALLPWYGENTKTARLICDIYCGFGAGRLLWDPRAIAQKAEDELVKQGYTTSYWGPEVEFFVFDKAVWDTLTPYRGQGYSIESREAAWGGSSYSIRFKEGYCPAPPQDTLMVFRSECIRILEDYFSIRCDAHHHEVATAGQCEVDILYDTLTKTADNVVTIKYVVKNVAVQHNMVATMMPKPIFADNASGMHVHMSIWRDGVNLFFDERDEYAELSQLARYYVGGLLEHAEALSAIVSPTTNSYRRLVPGYEAPVYVSWSRSNRSTLVRIPVYEKGSKSAAKKRVEYRAPDPSANPYLCFAALLAAGLDGIKKKIEIGDPVDENIYKLTPERRRELGIKELPGSLKEAVEALKSDQEFLKPIFPSEAIDLLLDIELKEYLEVSMRPHPYEFYLYFDI
jgi:glutamine synthetase